MKRISIGAFAKRTLFISAMVVVLCAAGATTSGSLLAQEMANNSDSSGRAANVFSLLRPSGRTEQTYLRLR